MDEKGRERKFLVLHIITEPVRGGAELLVRELNRRLPGHGVESRVLYLANSAGIFLEKREECLNLYSPRSPAAICKIRSYLKRAKVGNTTNFIVHAHLTWPFIYSAVAGLRLNIPLVYTEHNTHNRRREIFLARYLDRVTYGRYRLIICISEGTKKALLAWVRDPRLEENSIVIENGARLLHFKTQCEFQKGAFRLVSVGSLTHQKGFDLAISAVSEVRSIVRRYVIVGEGPERDKLRHLINRLELEETVQLVGWADDITPYLHDADVALIPSRWEGFGLVAVEALSCGLPIIATDVPGLDEVVRGCPAVWKIPPESVAALVETLFEVHKTLTEGLSVARAARKQAEMFPLENMVGRYYEAYRRVLKDYMLWA